MNLELKRIAPLRAAYVGALVYGLLTCVFAILIFPFILLVSAFAPREGGFPGGPVFALGMLVLYPLIGTVVGGITGLLTSVIYNFVTGLSGGLRLEVDGIPADSIGR